MKELLNDTKSEMVVVEQSYLEYLEKEIKFLNALKEAGVDNWMGWDDAWKIFRGEEVD